jgi:predicted ribosomally synthesized peptide with SipW-like signal peptide
MRRLAATVVAWSLGVAAGLGTGSTLAAFSSTTSNGVNDFTAASSFCASPGAQTLMGEADATVDQGNANSNFGGSSTLVVRSAQTLFLLPNNARSFVRFPLPAVPAYCTLTGATLRLNASSAQTGRTLQAFRAAAAWSESTLTWNNQPGVTGTAATTPSGLGWREWDVLAHVQAMYASQNDGFVVRDSQEGALSANTQTFSSRQGAIPPQLVLTFS